MEQKTDEWYRARSGHVTGSNVKDILPGKSGKYLKARQDYMAVVATERLTGELADLITARSLSWGTDLEEYARSAYEAETGNIVKEVGFINHPDVEWVGCSPDGLIDDDGGYESKCPANSSVHFDTILNGMPEDHMPQLQFNMWVTGREWWDFTSYDPRMPEHLRLYTQRVNRNQQYIDMLASEVDKFFQELNELVAKIPKPKSEAA